jgi:hypothetical protein
MPSLVHHQRYRHPHTHTPTHTNTHLPLMFLLYLRTRQTFAARYTPLPNYTLPSHLDSDLCCFLRHSPHLILYSHSASSLKNPASFLSTPVGCSRSRSRSRSRPHSSRLTSSRVSSISFSSHFPSRFPPPTLCSSNRNRKCIPTLLRFLLFSSLGSRASSSSSSFLRHLSQSMPTKKTKLAIHFPPFVRSFVRARIFDTCI